MSWELYGTAAVTAKIDTDFHQGYPEDIVVAVALGADMFDCVWPTRTAVSGIVCIKHTIFQPHADMTFWTQRFGNAITSQGVLNLKSSRYALDFGPVEADCTCTSCRSKEAGGLGVTRAFIHHLAAKETVGAHLYVAQTLLFPSFPAGSLSADAGIRLTMHNVHHLLSLMRRARNAILEDQYPEFARDFFAKYFAGKGPPDWAVEALKGVRIEL